jgi:hypothetical protein
VAEGVITGAVVNALDTTMKKAGYSEYLREPAKFVTTLALNDGFAAITPSALKLGGPEGAITLATIRTTSQKLVAVANAGVGLATDMSALRKNFIALNGSADTLDQLAKAAKQKGNLEESERLLRVEQSTRDTVSSLRSQFTYLGISILD